MLASYLERLAAALAGLGLPALHVMGSSGGVLDVAEALRMPAAAVESGPAAGIIAAQRLGDQVGRANLISFDMGGTTAKASLIENGRIETTSEYEVGGQGNVGRWLHGTVHPIRVPVIDLAEVSAGGGSIAWIDPGGALRVGPECAGAEPGPACYGHENPNESVQMVNVRVTATGRLPRVEFYATAATTGGGTKARGETAGGSGAVPSDGVAMEREVWRWRGRCGSASRFSAPSSAGATSVNELPAMAVPRRPVPAPTSGQGAGSMPRPAPRPAPPGRVHSSSRKSTAPSWCRPAGAPSSTNAASSGCRGTTDARMVTPRGFGRLDRRDRDARYEVLSPHTGVRRQPGLNRGCLVVAAAH